MFSIAQRPFIFYLYFSNQIEFDLKSINQEFLLFRKSLNKQPIQYLIKRSKVSKQYSFKYSWIIGRKTTVKKKITCWPVTGLR